jgi:hypothetical protein
MREHSGIGGEELLAAKNLPAVRRIPDRPERA